MRSSRHTVDKCCPNTPPNRTPFIQLTRIKTKVSAFLFRVSSRTFTMTFDIISQEIDTTFSRSVISMPVPIRMKPALFLVLTSTFFGKIIALFTTSYPLT